MLQEKSYEHPPLAETDVRYISLSLIEALLIEFARVLSTVDPRHLILRVEAEPPARVAAIAAEGDAGEVEEGRPCDPGSSVEDMCQQLT